VNQRLESLREKLAARRSRPGFEENVKHLRARIAELEARKRDAD
jgi:hypothetical protein